MDRQNVKYLVGIVIVASFGGFIAINSGFSGLNESNLCQKEKKVIIENMNSFDLERGFDVKSPKLPENWKTVNNNADYSCSKGDEVGQNKSRYYCESKSPLSKSNAITFEKEVVSEDGVIQNSQKVYITNIVYSDQEYGKKVVDISCSREE